MTSPLNCWEEKTKHFKTKWYKLFYLSPIAFHVAGSNLHSLEGEMNEDISDTSSEHINQEEWCADKHMWKYIKVPSFCFLRSQKIFTIFIIAEKETWGSRIYAFLCQHKHEF